MATNAPIAYNEGALVGQVVPKSYLPSFIVLSCLSSYIGSWTTLELLHRRTSLRGMQNRLLIACASIALGGVAVWGMTFVGQRAVILGDGTPGIQPYYSPGFTALAFFFPVVVFSIALSIMGPDDQIGVVSVSLGAVVAAGGACATRYLGQIGITNYVCEYQVGYSIASALILVISFVVGLLVFFTFKVSWHSDWWKRGLCAVLIATAICSSNWLASVGERLRFIRLNQSNDALSYENAVIITVFVLFSFACMMLVGLTALAHRRVSYAMQESQQVALAVAIFDQDGRIMVSPDGLLPTRRIADEYYEKNIYDVFGNRHPLFLWIFRASHYWLGVTELLPPMRRHLQRLGLKVSRISSRITSRSKTHMGFKLTTNSGDPIENYSAVFRELFCVVAAELAEDIQVPLQSLGVIFDEVIPTGLDIDGYARLQWFRGAPNIPPADVERGSAPDIGRGQMLFLTNCVDRPLSTVLQANGFRFASPLHVSPILSRAMQIPKHLLETFLDRMWRYARNSTIRQPGVHLECFAIRPSIKMGFDVVVQKEAKNLLPSVHLPFPCLGRWEEEYLKTLDNFPLSKLRNYLRRVSRSTVTPAHEKNFTATLLQGLESLKADFNDPAINDALFVAKPFRAPCQGFAHETAEAILIAFKLIIPVHTRRPLGKDLVYWPLNLFQTQQRVYENSSDQFKFARRTLREFAPIFGTDDKLSAAESSSSRRLGPLKVFHDRENRLHVEVEVGHETDAAGNVTRKTLQRPKSRIQKHNWFPWFLSPDRRDETKAVEIFLPAKSENKSNAALASSPTGSGSEQELDQLHDFSHSFTRPVNDVPHIKDKVKTGQVSLVAEEDLERTTFVDEMFEKCVESKIGRMPAPTPPILAGPENYK